MTPFVATLRKQPEKTLFAILKVDTKLQQKRQQMIFLLLSKK